VLSRKYESGAINYDMYCGLACMLVAADISTFVNRLTALVKDPGLRMSLGEAGKKHARKNYDWKIIYQRYIDLFNDLRKIRKDSGEKWCVAIPPTPPTAPDKQTPDQLFGHFATRRILMDDAFEVLLHTLPRFLSEYKNLSRTSLFSFSQGFLPSDEMVSQLFLHSGTTLQSFSINTGAPADTVVTACIILAKMGLLRLIPADGRADLVAGS
jgi:starch synthase